MKQKNLLLAVLVLIKVVLHFFLIDTGYELHRDEFLHIDQGHHLAWGYDSVPPVTSWLSWLILQLGGGVFWVKFFPVLFGALTMVVVWKTIELLKGGYFALVTGAVAILLSVMARINILYQPNSLDILCWTAFYYALIRYFVLQETRWIYGAAIILAIGFLNKYNIAFLILGLLPALLFTPQISLLRNKHLYRALLLALLLVSPHLWWQYQHHFPAFQHLKELQETQLVHVNRIDFLKEQLLFFVNSLPYIVVGWLAVWIYPPFKTIRFLGLSFLLTLGLFLYFQAKGYYAIGLYPVYIALGAVALEDALSKGWKRKLRPVLAVALVAFCIPVFLIAFPNRSPEYIAIHPDAYRGMGMLRWEDGKDHMLPQDFADMRGWKEMAALVDKAYQKIPDPEHVMVLCDNYGQAGGINYYSAHRQLGAVCMSSDYLKWFGLDNRTIRHIILVQESDDDDPERKKEADLFEHIEAIGMVTDTFAREQGTRVYLLQNATKDINQLLHQEIDPLLEKE